MERLIPEHQRDFFGSRNIGRGRANGTAFENADVIIKRSDSLKVEWKAPLMFNDQNELILDIFAETDTDVYQMECTAMEKDFYDGATVFHWDIPPTELAKLPATPKAEIRLTRMHHLKARTSGIAGIMVGARIYTAPATLD